MGQCPSDGGDPDGLHHPEGAKRPTLKKELEKSLDAKVKIRSGKLSEECVEGQFPTPYPLSLSLSMSVTDGLFLVIVLITISPMPAEI